MRPRAAVSSDLPACDDVPRIIKARALMISLSEEELQATSSRSSRRSKAALVIILTKQVVNLSEEPDSPGFAEREPVAGAEIGASNSGEYICPAPPAKYRREIVA